ncbi:MAG: hypothetical protein AB1938_13650 [Myxococcota bacterium]
MTTSRLASLCAFVIASPTPAWAAPPPPEPQPKPPAAATASQLTPDGAKFDCAQDVATWKALDLRTPAERRKILAASQRLRTHLVFERCSSAALEGLLFLSMERLEDATLLEDTTPSDGIRIEVRLVAQQLLTHLSGEELPRFSRVSGLEPPGQRTEPPPDDAAVVAAWKAWWVTASKDPARVLEKGRSVAAAVKQAQRERAEAWLRRSRLKALHAWKVRTSLKPSEAARLDHWGAFVRKDHQLLRVSVQASGSVIETPVEIVDTFAAGKGPAVTRWPHGKILALTVVARGPAKMPAALLKDLAAREPAFYAELLEHPQREFTVIDGDLVVSLGIVGP